MRHPSRRHWRGGDQSPRQGQAETGRPATTCPEPSARARRSRSRCKQKSCSGAELDFVSVPECRTQSSFDRHSSRETAWQFLDLVPVRFVIEPSRSDHRGVDLISDVLPFGRLWYDTPDNAIGYAMHFSRSHDAVIRVYDEAGNIIETQEHRGSLKEPRNILDLVLWHSSIGG